MDCSCSRRSWRTLWVDRRSLPQCVAAWLVVAWAIAYSLMSAAVASTLYTGAGVGGNTLTQGDLVKWQWWLIAGLIGLVSLIAQGFIIYVFVGINRNIRKLFELHEGVLTVDTHKIIDHSQLCPVCRTAHLVVAEGEGHRP